MDSLPDLEPPGDGDDAEESGGEPQNEQAVINALKGVAHAVNVITGEPDPESDEEEEEQQEEQGAPPPVRTPELD